MFTKATLLSVLAGLAVAAPTARQQVEEFTLIAIRSGDIEIHQHSINARGEFLTIGAPTTASCPKTAGAACANTQNTTSVFAALVGAPASTLTLENEKPDHLQQVYVNPIGALQYLSPSSDYVLPGSQKTGFQYEAGSNIGSTGSLTFNYQGFYACPIPSIDGSSAFDIFAAGFETFVPKPECVEIAIETESYEGKLAYQYD